MKATETPATGHTFRLINVGRGKFTGEVRVSSARELLKEVCKHLRSVDVAIADTGAVMVGGWRQVGKVEPVGEAAEAEFRRWAEESDE